MEDGSMPTRIESLLDPIRRLHERIRDAVIAACERSAIESLSRVAQDEEGDTIYAVDRVSEELIVEFFDAELSSREPIVLIAEGLEGGQITLPRDKSESDAAWRVIVD